MKNKIIRHNVITRNIFNKIHLEQNKNLFSKSKVSNLISTKILNLKNNYFLNKVCADLGCGSTGLGALNLFNLGAKFVYLLDMNKHIINMKIFFVPYIKYFFFIKNSCHVRSSSSLKKCSFNFGKIAKAIKIWIVIYTC